MYNVQAASKHSDMTLTGQYNTMLYEIFYVNLWHADSASIFTSEGFFSVFLGA